MNYTLKIRRGDREVIVTRVRAPKVGSTVKHEGLPGWRVLSCESLLKSRVTPFEMVIPNHPAAA
jgi:hypothetical protein